MSRVYHPQVSSLYVPINATDDIRLLHIQSGVSDERIICNLSTANIRQFPKYEALSYTWGSLEYTKSITCNGCRVMVTENLYDALQQLRPRDGTRTIWIDAICINQSDDIEKSLQVRIMHQIYQQAQHVYIWLGTAPEEDEKAIRLLKALSSLFRRYPGSEDFHGIIKPTEEGMSHLNMLEPEGVAEMKRLFAPPDTTAWKALACIFHHPWFTRVWVIQEVIFASSATFMRGEHCVEWPELVQVLGSILESGLSYSSYQFLLAGLTGSCDFVLFGTMCFASQIRGQVRDGNRDCNSFQLERLLYTLTVCRALDATDPRDKIFALANIVNAPGDHPMIPDYTKNTFQIYVDMTVWLLERPEVGFLILQLIIPATGEKCDPDLPSWVIDWTQVRAGVGVTLPLESEKFKAGGEVEHHISFNDSKTKLHTLAKHLGVIGKMSMSHDDRFREESKGIDEKELPRKIPGIRAKMTAELKAFVSVLAPYPTGECIEDVLGRAQVTDDIDLDILRHEYAVVDRLNGSSIDHLSVSAEESVAYVHYSKIMGLRSNLRAPCSTTNGYFGFVHPNARPGDDIFAFPGASVPFVLRKANDTEYTMVGECYLHGLMSGEAMTDNKTELRDLTIV